MNRKYVVLLLLSAGIWLASLDLLRRLEASRADNTGRTTGDPTSVTSAADDVAAAEQQRLGRKALLGEGNSGGSDDGGAAGGAGQLQAQHEQQHEQQRDQEQQQEGALRDAIRGAARLGGAAGSADVLGEATMLLGGGGGGNAAAGGDGQAQGEAQHHQQHQRQQQEQQQQQQQQQQEQQQKQQQRQEQPQQQQQQLPGSGHQQAAARAAAANGATAVVTLSGLPVAAAEWDPAIILFCYNRTDYLKSTLASMAGLAGLGEFSVYVSQDGNAEHVSALVQRFAEGPFRPPVSRRFEHWQRERLPKLGAKQPGHAWLTQHYGYGLDRVFLEKGHSHVVIVEDDMLFSPDFLTYFKATAPLLDADPTLWCVSSWNDNGLKTFEWRPQRMFRTSYFPGLGWMMRRQLWAELAPKWPLESWDHWMRMEGTAKGRDCVVPEVNRNKNIGEVGANMDKRVFRRYLSIMGWGTDELAASDYGDLGYLLEAEYRQSMLHALGGAQVWNWRSRRVIGAPSGGRYLLLYALEQYTRLAAQLRTWPYPRGHFRHIAYVPFRGSVFYLADQRFCELLPPSQRLLPNPTLGALPGERNESCDDACGRSGRTCSTADFWFINTCEVLAAHFACERGCTVVLGLDVPNYVLNASQPTYQQCLVTQQQPRCGAAHPDTARLCPCVAPGTEADVLSQQQALLDKQEQQGLKGLQQADKLQQAGGQQQQRQQEADPRDVPAGESTRQGGGAVQEGARRRR